MKTILKAFCATVIFMCLGCEVETPREETVESVASDITIICTVYYWDNMQCQVCDWSNGCHDWSCVDNNGIYYSDSYCP